MDYLVAIAALTAFGGTWRVGAVYLGIKNKWLNEAISCLFGFLILLIVTATYLAVGNPSFMAHTSPSENNEAVQKGSDNNYGK